MFKIFKNTLSISVIVNLFGTRKSSKLHPRVLYNLYLFGNNLIEKEISPESLNRLPTNVLISVDLPDPFYQLSQ